MGKELMLTPKPTPLKPAWKDMDVYLGGIWTFTGSFNLSNSLINPADPGEVNLFLVAAVFNFAMLPLSFGNRMIRKLNFRKALERWEKEQKQMEAAADRDKKQIEPSSDKA